jgi:hypothetical protein
MDCDGDCCCAAEMQCGMLCVLEREKILQESNFERHSRAMMPRRKATVAASVLSVTSSFSKI